MGLLQRCRSECDTMRDGCMDQWEVSKVIRTGEKRTCLCVFNAILRKGRTTSISWFSRHSVTKSQLWWQRSIQRQDINTALTLIYCLIKTLSSSFNPTNLRNPGFICSRNAALSSLSGHDIECILGADVSQNLVKVTYRPARGTVDGFSKNSLCRKPLTELQCSRFVGMIVA